MRPLKWIPVCLALLIWSCNGQQEKPHDHGNGEHLQENSDGHSHKHGDGDQHDHVHEHEDDHHEAVSHPKVMLNNGEKWQANPETSAGISNMLDLAERFGRGEAAAATDCADLAKALKKEFNTIFEKCTMKGEAHDQLHKFLLPMVQQFKLIGEGKGNECKQHVKSLTSHLKEYGNYFI